MSEVPALLSADETQHVTMAFVPQQALCTVKLTPALPQPNVSASRKHYSCVVYPRATVDSSKSVTSSTVILANPL